ncbi:MAG: EAL domain-containing protein [Lachnospiraceae bacterium]|nr:EAL domain-containing protein [Lachnospiraceae bacterium]
MLGFLEDVKVQICGLIPLLLICFFGFFRSKKGVTLKGSYIYRQLLIITTLCVTMDIASVLSIGRAPYFWQVFLSRAYLWTTIMTGYISVYYIWYNISKLKKHVKKRKITSVIVVIAATIIAFVLPFKMHTKFGEFYTYGLAVSMTFALCGGFIIVFLGMTFIFKNSINSERRIAAQVWMFIEAAGSAVQFFDRKMLVVSYTMALGVMILCVKIENPDAWIDRNTGAYSFQMLKEYLRELYEVGKSCACVIVGEREYHAKHFSMNEQQIIEIANHLGKLSKGKVFCGIGNSFILVFSSEEEARNAIEKIQVPINSQKEEPTASPAIFLIPDINITGDTEELFLMYQQMANIGVKGNEEVTIIDSETIRRLYEYRATQREIINALDEDRIEVFLQPIYSTYEKCFVSAEALVRMRNQEGNIIAPRAFIPVAESSGMIGQIGDRVFEKVCGFIQEGVMKKLGIRYIEVNLSIMQCEDITLAKRYADVIRSYGIEPSAINLEITETGQMQNRKVLMKNLESLREFGCGFSLDDFGTGESNLNYIVEMPVDIVKFDRSMILSYFTNDKTRLMMEYVTKMIKRMNMKIVAEGVEEEYQLKALEELGIDYIQGYYFSKPVTKDEFIQFIEMNYA